MVVRWSGRKKRKKLGLEQQSRAIGHGRAAEMRYKKLRNSAASLPTRSHAVRLERLALRVAPHAAQLPAVGKVALDTLTGTLNKETIAKRRPSELLLVSLELLQFDGTCHTCIECTVVRANCCAGNLSQLSRYTGSQAGCSLAASQTHSERDCAGVS